MNSSDCCACVVGVGVGVGFGDGEEASLAYIASDDFVVPALWFESLLWNGEKCSPFRSGCRGGAGERRTEAQAPPGDHFSGGAGRRLGVSPHRPNPPRRRPGARRRRGGLHCIPSRLLRLARVRALAARPHPAEAPAPPARVGRAVRRRRRPPRRRLRDTFFHTRTARSPRVRLPKLRCHRIVGFTDGLIILLHKRTTAVRVLNPFTGVAVDLPPLAPVFHQVVKNRNSLLYMLHQRHVSDDPHCRHRLVPLHGWSARL